MFTSAALSTFYLLYVITGGGVLNNAWGGPALVRFENQRTCEAAADAMRHRKYVIHAECVVVQIPSPFG